MTYREVANYYRQEHFEFFSGYSVPFYNVTFELDITEVKGFADSHGYSTYLSLCHMFVRGMNRVEDFRYRVLNGKIVLYDRLDVAATLPASGGAFSFARFDWEPDLKSFLARAETRSAEARKVAALDERTESNAVLFTALPGVRFTGFTHATPSDRTDGRPRVAFGRFVQSKQRLLMPVGLGVNHIFIDGASIGALVDEVRCEYDEPH
jgi:chloramphenicol O-acetyltransferase type A